MITVKRWLVPMVVALVCVAVAGPVVGLLAGILAALVWPPFTMWWDVRRYQQAVERQSKFLEEYDVCAVSTADYESLVLATWGDTESGKAVLLDRKALRKAESLYPTKAKTAADKKAIYDKEEERRLGLGFPSQSVRRDFKSEWPLYKPHYQHLKSGLKVETCWLCDQDSDEANQRHLEIWSRVEREGAEQNTISANRPPR
jgi:hypothetical protein